MKGILQFFLLILVVHIRLLAAFVKRLPIVSHILAFAKARKKPRPAAPPRAAQSENDYACHEPQRSEGYKEGVHRCYYSNGALQREAFYEGGRIHGVSRHWYENGVMSYEGTYKYDRLEGISRSWYKNGQLERETPHVNGEKHGIEKCYDENGRLVREAPVKYGRSFD